MQNNFDHEYICLKSEEEDATENSKTRQEYHQQHVSNLFDTIASFACLDATIAEQCEETHHEGFKKELTFWETQPVEFPYEEDKGGDDEEHAEVLVVEEERLQGLSGSWLLGLGCARRLTKWLLWLVTLLQVVWYQVLRRDVCCHSFYFIKFQI